MKFKDNLNVIKNCLPFSLRPLASILPENAQEIRLRACQPVTVTIPQGSLFVSESFKLIKDCSESALKITQRELAEIFTAICSYSVYSKQDEIKDGFVTFKGGCRAGICGTAVIRDGRIANIRDLTSINLRLCSQRLGCCEKVLKVVEPLGGVLICGVPCSGKTTVLRDLARALSYKFRTVLIDSRSELAAVYAGVAQNDIGLCDVMNSYPRNSAFKQAVRCLSPELIICDEIGGAEDARSILNARKSGVSVIASAHCGDRDDLFGKPYLRQLISTKCFEYAVFLDSGDRVGQIREVLTLNELF